MMKTSFYVNNPLNPDEDADDFKKIIVYDKYLKDSKYKIIDNSFKNWKRLEVTLNIQHKLKGFIFDDYLIDVLNLASKYFKFNDFNLDYIERQLKLLTDKRTHKGIAIVQ